MINTLHLHLDISANVARIQGMVLACDWDVDMQFFSLEMQETVDPNFPPRQIYSSNENNKLPTWHSSGTLNKSVQSGTSLSG